MSTKIKKMYRDAGLAPPDGKGIHTVAFHRCVIGVKMDIRAGKMAKGSNPYALCMAKMTAARAVKKSHRKS